MILQTLAAAATLLARDTVSLSLDAAVTRAVARSPAVQAALAAARAPRGLLSETRWPFPENPAFELGRTRRQAPAATTTDRQWSVTQDVEIGGQWLLRSRGATALLESAEAAAADARRVVALEARRGYVALAIAEGRAALTDSAAAFAERLAGFAHRQFDAGEINRLELNVALLEAARARSTAERAHGDASDAAAELGRIVGLPGDSVIRTSSLPAIPQIQWSSDARLIALARARRPDLISRSAAARSADRFVTAAKLATVPSLSATLYGGREAGTDRLQGVAFGVRLPLYHRQQAAVGAADAARAAAAAELAAADRALQAEVTAASARFLRAREAERRFATDVLRAATDNVALTERALAEGEVGVTEVLVLRTTAVAAQLEYLEVLRAAANAWFELAAALAAEPDALPGLLGRNS